MAREFIEAKTYLSQRAIDSKLLKDFKLIDKEKHQIKDLTKEHNGSKIIDPKKYNGFIFHYPTQQEFVSLVAKNNFEKLGKLISEKNLNEIKKLSEGTNKKANAEKAISRITSIYNSSFNSAIKLEQTLNNFDYENNLNKREKGSSIIYLVEKVIEGRLEKSGFVRAPLYFKEATIKKDIKKREIKLIYNRDDKIIPNYSFFYDVANQRNIVIEDLISGLQWSSDSVREDIDLVLDRLGFSYDWDDEKVEKVSRTIDSTTIEEKYQKAIDLFINLERIRFLNVSLTEIVLGSGLDFVGMNEESQKKYIYLTKSNDEIEELIENIHYDLEDDFEEEDEFAKSVYDVSEINFGNDWRQEAKNVREEFKIFMDKHWGTDEKEFSKARESMALQLLSVNSASWEQYVDFVEDGITITDEEISKDVILNDSWRIKGIKYVFKTFKLGSRKLEEEVKEVLEDGIIERIESKRYIDSPDDVLSESSIDWTHNSDYSQRMAVRKSLSSDCHIIQGPPGTGKTQTILNIVSELSKQGKKVLVVSEKKTAVEVIAERLKKGEVNLYESFIEIYRDSDWLNSIKELSKIVDIQDKNINFDSEIKFKSNSDKIYWLEKFIGTTEKITDEDLESLEILDNFTAEEINEIRKLRKLGISNENDFNSKIDIYNKHQNLKHILNTDNNLAKWMIDNLYSGDRSLEKTYLTLHRRIKKPFFWSKNKFATKVMNDMLANNYHEKLISSNLIDYWQYDPVWYEPIVEFEDFEEWDKFEILNDELIDVIDRFESINACYKESNPFEFETFNDDEIFENNINSILYDIKNTSKETFKYDIALRKKFHELKDRKVNNKTVKNFIRDNWETISELFPIVIGTLETVSEHLPLEEGMFDYVIIDEASQIFIERALPSLYRAKNYIISGDKKQLRPFKYGYKKITSETIANSDCDYVDWIENDSLLDLFSQILGPENQTLLEVHYRSNSYDLIKYSNDNFYESKLSFVPSKSFIDNSIELIRVETDWKAQVSQNEINEIHRLIEELVANGEKSIGIISMSDKQTGEIKKHLMKNASEELNSILNSLEGDGIFIKALNDVQGDERDVIIFSIGYDGKSARYGHINTLYGENRLNVAASRAREKIIVVMNGDPSNMKGRDLSNPGVDAFLNFIDFVNMKNEIKEEIESNIDSSFIEYLNKLKIKKYTIHSDGKFTCAIDEKGNAYFNVDQYSITNVKSHLWKYTSLLGVRGYNVNHFFKLGNVINSLEEKGWISKIDFKETKEKSNNKKKKSIW